MVGFGDKKLNKKVIIRFRCGKTKLKFRHEDELVPFRRWITVRFKNEN